MEWRSQLKIIFPATIGNVLEWYDFSLFGYFAVVIAELFFPSQDKSLSLLRTFGIFAVGYILRPVGAVLFGHWGDRLGRKKTLSIGIILMAGSTLVMGLLPTYAEIGSAAGIILVICRMFQGIAIGGEYAGSIIYLAEHAPPRQRGLTASLALFSTFIGLFIGSAVAALTSWVIEPSAFKIWGWRIPFIASVLLGGVGFYIRQYLPETPPFLTLKLEKKIVRQPLLYSLKIYPVVLLKLMLLTFLPAIASSLMTVYLPTYLNAYLKVPLHIGLIINTIGLLMSLMVPIAGFWSDKIGRKKILAIATACFILFSYPLFLILHMKTFVMILAAQAGLVFLTSLLGGAMPAIMTEIVPRKTRYTAMSLPFNLAFGIFGGTTPLVVTYLIAKTGDPFIPAYYLILAGFVMIGVMLTIKETAGKIL